MAKKVYVGVNNVARKVKKWYTGIANFIPRSLPSGYTQTEYIQSSGTQYINTGFKPNNNTRVVFTCDLYTQATAAWFFGARESTGTKGFALLTYQNKLRVDYGSTTDGGYFTHSFSGKHTVDVDKNVVKVDGATEITLPAETFQSPAALTLFANNTNGTIAGYSSTKLYSCQIYDNGTLVRDFVPCKNSGGTVGLYDLVNGAFYAGTGTFTAGTSEAKGIARKVKKGYIGVGGVARPFIGGGLEYYGTLTSFPDNAGNGAATHVGNYALFGGGTVGSVEKNQVVAYSSNLTQSIPTELSEKVCNLAATHVGSYALFGGGYTDNANGAASNAVNAYNTSLTRSTTTLRTYAGNLGGGHVGNYALFAGGWDEEDDKSIVTAFNSSLTKSSPSNLSKAGGMQNGAHVGDYVLFNGGSDGKQTDAYNSSLTRTTVTSLPIRGDYTAATSVGNYAVISGFAYSSSCATIAYDNALTQLSAPDASISRKWSAATHVGDYALFGGGYTNDGQTLSTVESYDASLTKKIEISLSEARRQLMATHIGNYAIFGGGYYTSTVDAYVNLD